MSLAVAQDGDLTNEIRYQKDVLKSLGLTEGEILDLIHDRHARAPISAGQAQIALASVRHAAGLAHHAGPPTVRRSRSPTQALDARTEQYMRASGRAPRPRPPDGPRQVLQKHSAEAYEARPAPPATPTEATRPPPCSPRSHFRFRTAFLSTETLYPRARQTRPQCTHVRAARGSWSCTPAQYGPSTLPTR